jgi:hypothetical protein
MYAPPMPLGAKPTASMALRTQAVQKMQLLVLLHEDCVHQGCNQKPTY